MRRNVDTSGMTQDEAFEALYGRTMQAEASKVFGDHFRIGPGAFDTGDMPPDESEVQTYRPITFTVQAARVPPLEDDGEQFDPFGAVQDIAAWCGGNVQYLEEHTSAYGIVVRNGTRHTWAAPGDWVVRKQGRWEVYRNDDFGDMFELVEEERMPSEELYK